MAAIHIRGARTHNLKNIDLDLPRDELIVITGLSGSGKSSLAFDTIFAEGQRRYVESLSAYARQFLARMEKPDVDHIEGLSPAISIEQKSTSHNPRSTVGTITEIYDYLRLLYARVGTPRCPEHHIDLNAQTVSQMVDKIMQLPSDSRMMLLAPVVQNRKGEHLQLLQGLHAQGFLRARIDGEVYELDDPPKLDLRKKHNIEVVVDRFKIKPEIELRLAESLETALKLADDVAQVAYIDAPDKEPILFSAKFACPVCGYSVSELEPRLFSFNNPIGACSVCDGLGTEDYFDPELIVNSPQLSCAGGAIRGWDRRNAHYFQMIQSLAEHYQFDINTPYGQLTEDIQDLLMYGSGKEIIAFSYVNQKGRTTTKQHAFEGIIPTMERRYHETSSNLVRDELSKYLATQPCSSCHGDRLNVQARNVFINDANLPSLTAISVQQALDFFNTLDLDGQSAQVGAKVILEIRDRLSFLVNVGLDYLSLERSADTLSGGEAQRIRLASQIGSGLVGVMYVLDEPSIGLHQRDNHRLLETLTRLRDLGNTVIVVEHDEEAIRAADYLVDIGPGAGCHGGEVVAQGTAEQVYNNPKSLTGQYLSGQRAIEVPQQRTATDPDKQLVVEGVCGNNLKSVTAEFPVGCFIAVTGVSGSGKSTLVNDTVYACLARALNKSSIPVAEYERIAGIEHFDKVVDIDQSPIGRTPRSNPATYTGLFTPIRELFTGTQEARSRGYNPGRFSFNVKGGRCEACQGDGVIRVEMHFLPDVYVPCEVCKGQRYNRETLEIRYKGKNIFEVLQMTIEDALDFFNAVPVVKRKLATLVSVGLTYISLGQSATTLSGGEAQRVKLARELSKRDTGKTLYILDEPTTGLHFYDVEQLLGVLHQLRDHGNTVIVIEHNLDVIKTADWVIDLGPEGGAGGGEIIATGTPEQIVKCKQSYTGKFLKPLLQRKAAKR
ncbi:MAG: excinuclease ABC subunit A [Gammaproteobacteria bacterium TMED119]|nr:MAG: excinuclease ABC subunit A [Gammaproteobacteria bacterium TMED119]